MYSPFLDDTQAALEGLRDALVLFDKISEARIELERIHDNLAQLKAQGSIGHTRLANVARKQASALQAKQRTLDAVLRHRIPDIANARAFLRLGTARLPGPAGSFKAPAYALLLRDAKAREVRLQSLLPLLLRGGFQGCKHVPPALHWPKQPVDAIGTTFLVEWLAPDNTKTIVALTLTDVDVTTIDDVIKATPGGAETLVVDGTRRALVTAMGGKVKAKGPFCMFRPQLLYPVYTETQLIALFETRDQISKLYVQ